MARRFAPVREEILDPLGGRVERLNEGEEPAAFRVESNGVAFDLVLWSGEDRVSFFIGGQEVMDETLADDAAARDAARWIRTVLSNPVEVEVRPGRVRYRYFVPGPGGVPEPVEERPRSGCLPFLPFGMPRRPPGRHVSPPLLPPPAPSPESG